MAVIALLIGLVGGWRLAAPWWLAYALVQVASDAADRRSDRWGFGPVYALSFVSFAVAGAPSLHLWSHDGVLGVAAASMFLSGMLAQLVASSLAARKLFFASAAPLFGYMIAAPALYFGAAHPQAMLASLACPVLLAVYLAVVWLGQQSVLDTVEQSRRAAEAATRVKSEFLAVMSHEIRTPLNAVLGAAELLDGTELSPEQRRFVGVLRQGGTLLMQVLNDVLDFSKIEAGRLSIEPTDVDLHGLVERCAAFWRTPVGEAGLALQVAIDPAVPRRVMLDPTRTEQILFNLISNAVKFTERGAIILALDLGRPAEGAIPAEIVLSVADTGIGMSPDVLQRLFAPFEQADGSITRRFGGTGLGLAISQKLARMMGGSIAVESAERNGSTFRLTLPVALAAEPASEAPEPAEPSAAPSGPPLRVLVAEDNDANRIIIDHFLRVIGADVTFVVNGAEAVDVLQAQPFEVVLMDVRMPVMDGMEATRRVRASGGPNVGTPILALTADVMDGQRDACVRAGMTGHIAKPIDARLLLSSVMAAGADARRRRPRQAAA